MQNPTMKSIWSGPAILPEIDPNDSGLLFHVKQYKVQQVKKEQLEHDEKDRIRWKPNRQWLSRQSEHNMSHRTLFEAYIRLFAPFITCSLRSRSYILV